MRELAIAARTGLFVPPDRTGLITAEGLWQRVVVLRHIAGERRGQVVAQRQPLLVIVLKGEDALVRPVFVGQELAERIRIFKSGRLQRVEAIAFIDLANARKHARFRTHQRGRHVAKPLRHARLGAEGLFFLAHGLPFGEPDGCRNPRPPGAGAYLAHRSLRHKRSRRYRHQRIRSREWTGL